MTNWIQCRDRMPMGEACIAAFRRRDGHDNGVERYMESANAESLRKGYEEVCGKSPNWIDRTEWRPLDEAPLHDEGEPATWHDETRGEDEDPDLESHVYTVKPGCDEAVRDLLRSDKPVPERLRELMAEPAVSTDAEAVKAGFVRALTQKETDERDAADLSWWYDMYHQLATAAMKAWQERRESEVVRDGAELHDLFERAESEEETLRAALEHFTLGGQWLKLAEEAAELAAACARHANDNDEREGLVEDAIEEMADVSILLDQMRLVYGAEIDAARARKLARLRERLGR